MLLQRRSDVVRHRMTLYRRLIDVVCLWGKIEIFVSSKELVYKSEGDI